VKWNAFLLCHASEVLESSEGHASPLPFLLSSFFSLHFSYLKAKQYSYKLTITNYASQEQIIEYISLN